MAGVMAAVADRIERPARNLIDATTADELIALASIAISLTRIADAFDRLAPGAVEEND